jgi:hypothetical protein
MPLAATNRHVSHGPGRQSAEQVNFQPIVRPLPIPMLATPRDPHDSISLAGTGRETGRGKKEKEKETVLARHV